MTHLQPSSSSHLWSPCLVPFLFPPHTLVLDTPDLPTGLPIFPFSIIVVEGTHPVFVTHLQPSWSSHLGSLNFFNFLQASPFPLQGFVVSDALGFAGVFFLLFLVESGFAGVFFLIAGVEIIGNVGTFESPCFFL